MSRERRKKSLPAGNNSIAFVRCDLPLVDCVQIALKCKAEDPGVASANTSRWTHGNPVVKAVRVVCRTVVYPDDHGARVVGRYED